MGFFLENLLLSSWDLALYIIIVYLIISIVLYYATFYLKRKRLTKRKGEDIEQTSDEHSFLASIKSTRSSSLSTKTAKSEMARTQRESSRDGGGGKSNAILHVRSTQISARLSDGKTPLLPDNVLPKVKMPREHYFEEWKEDVTQELTKSIRERERPPPLKTAADEASKSGVASTKGNSSSSVTLSERGEVETSTNEGDLDK
ncbi:hypothetical protein Mgra_00001684 [Meloidogyne graminicola]|uniref:Uncharacterized protein n=1 Tax=Meloidogyne graminicola TaxID=189291 RepID=A0A8T0A0D1_9BILA|nr:hypothetical protein Mgra_00001684 [Meloidogyne graminicola]